jgi:DNA-directed RNA polymerase specialized sigma24 family protein
MTDREITGELFDALLEWLGPSREKAAEKYEAIRIRLIKIFQKKGCFDAESLFDKTVNRVTMKLPEIAGGYVGDPLWYFISVGRNVYREWLRVKEIPYESVPQQIVEPDPGLARQCLQKCLESLQLEERNLMLDYYCDEKGGKIDLRRQLAEERGVTLNALRVKAHRLRSSLEKCVMECLNG